ncbi:MAG: transporter substrate-binding domain-containing protein [Proteobacteria bacterium]|nr:transporter substrate-binding domain-containing protein [Pseudomonadota bacterium]
MLADFARRRGMGIQWIEAERPDELYQRLRRGEGDVIATDLAPEQARDASLLPSRSMGSYRYFAYGRQGIAAEDPRGLKGLKVAISVASPLWPWFEQLRREVAGIVPVLMPNGTPRETLLAGIASGHFDVAIAPARANEKPLADYTDLKALFEVSDQNPVVWYFPAERAALRDALDSYVQRFHAAVLTPQADYGDLAAIKSRGLLRAITRIDAQNYFVRNGRPAGFEYEMVQLFAREHRLRVEYLVADSDQQMLEWLRSGAGDLITTRVRAADVAADGALTQGRSYFHSASVLVGRTGSQLHDLTALAGKRVAVFGNTVEHRALSELVAAGIAIRPVVINPGTPPTYLAEQLENWSIDAAIVDAHLITDLRALHPLLEAGMSVPISYNYAWTTRAQNTGLLRAIDGFARSEFATDTYQILAQRYFDEPRFTYINALARLSPYDNLVRRYADTYDFDWRLIVAQMYFESQFNPAARSSGGALGLMQLTRDTARAMGVANPFDPDAGIRGGVRYLKKLRDHFEEELPPRERTWFALAAYNAGLTRVVLARERAAAAGLDPTRWFGNVETMMGREPNQRAVGPYREAVDYVRGIRSLYNTYNRQQESLTAGLERSPAPPRS